MQINSLLFLYFFAAFLPLYFIFYRNVKYRNIVLLSGSYTFYGLWDWRFLSLLIGTTLVCFYIGLKIQGLKSSATDESYKKAKGFLIFGLFCAVGNLFVFKYYGFFFKNILSFLNLLGLNLSIPSIKLIVPLGISYYSFKAVSYICDVYNGKILPESNIINYALYLSFFPEIIAGPIDKADFLLSQFREQRKFSRDRFYRGCYLLCWGLFKKIFIADNLTAIVSTGFGKPTPQSSLIVVAIYAYAVRIYCDFSGCIDMTRGCAAIIGFDTSINFNLPYFAKDPSDFWKRWHITLSVWIRDYLYIPLGGNRRGEIRTYLNLLIAMTLCGLWHGAGWKYIVWGAYHGTLLILYKKLSEPIGKFLKLENFFSDKVISALKIFFFFHLICFGWLIFRAENLSHVLDMSIGIFTSFSLHNSGILSLILYSLPLVVYQFFQYKKNDLEFIFSLDFRIRGVLYSIMFWLIVVYGNFGGNEFIYGKF